jgi:hypothetical protein
MEKVCHLGNVEGGKVHLSPIGLIVQEEWQNTPRIRPNESLDAFVEAQ